MQHSGILSNAGHEESCANVPGRCGRAKYWRETDSERVLSRKGEKSPEQGSEIVPESIRLQAVGASYDVTACLLHNDTTSYSHCRG